LTSLFAFALFLAAPSSAPAADPNCSFSRGTNTCVAVTQSTEHDQITMVSGCLYGPHGTPGRRERVFDRTFEVTTTTTTLAHGRNGPVYDSSTTQTRQLLSMVQISDTCYPQ